MPRAKPKTERSCLVCDVVFIGTPAATRCEPCKAGGYKVPRDQQQQQRRTKPPLEKLQVAKPQFSKTCQACGDDFQTHKPKAARCDGCIAEGRNVQHKVCGECGDKFPYHDPAQIRCDPCADLLGLDQFELTPAQLEELRERERKARWKDQLAAQRRWLDQRETAKIHGYLRMKKAIRATPIGILWVSLCHADGAASSVMHTTDTELTDAQKLHLLIVFHRIRCRGFHPSAIAKLCPQAILEGIGKDDFEEGLRGLPEVSQSVPGDDRFDPLEDLSPELRTDVIAFQEKQTRQIESIRLGLAS